MADAKGDETDDGDTEGKIFDAPYRIGIMQRDIHDARHIAGKQRKSDGDIEQDIDQRDDQIGRKRADQEIDGKSNEKIGDLIGLLAGIHGITSFFIRMYTIFAHRTENPAAAANFACRDS